MAEYLDLPLTYLLPTHIPEDQRLKLEDEIPNLTYDITEAKLVLGKVATSKRAEFELRSRDVVCEKVEPRDEGKLNKERRASKKEEVNDEDEQVKDESDGEAKVKVDSQNLESRNLKRKRSAASDAKPGTKKRRLGHIGGKKRKQEEEEEVKPAVKTEIKEQNMDDVITIDDSTTEGEDEEVYVKSEASKSQGKTVSSHHEREYSPSNKLSQMSKATSSMTLRGDETEEEEDHGEDADIDWEHTIKVVKLAWYEESVARGYLLPLDGYLVYEGRPIHKATLPTHHPFPRRQATPDDILLRARTDPPPKPPFIPYGLSRYDGGTGSSQAGSQSQHSITRPTHLLHETTSEHDNPNKLPQLPDYLHSTYSCQRPTPLHPPNEDFIKQLKKIRQSRVLTLDEIGVRAYSSAIASIAAYPHAITSPVEILRLPVCSDKIASLWQEWHEWGSISAVREIEADEELKILDVFYNIWGVGAKGARDFYYKKGWRDLDDVVEYGWNELSRVQQIGVKYYDEFLNPIPRDEVEKIGKIILDAANKVKEGSQHVIVGGYRRGKEESGDVDVVVSHPDEEVTSFMVTQIVEVLEQWGWITHTLLLSTANSERNQTPVSYKGEGVGVPGTGFDTLDKALVVWQDPDWPTKEADIREYGEEKARKKNPNTHRRVDIILSPWKTVGCAVAGWTSGTTFQRDLRRLVKTNGLKFDSSGVRSREDGSWVDYESRGGKCKTMLEAEKKVFEGLGLEWLEPTMRCTG